MTVHHARVIVLAAILGLTALVPLTACSGAQRPLHDLRVLAEQGDAEAQFTLGQQYSHGRSYGQGVERDQFEGNYLAGRPRFLLDKTYSARYRGLDEQAHFERAGAA